MSNIRTLKELVKRFQGMRAFLYFGEIIGMGIIDGLSVVLTSRIIGIITDTAVYGGNIWDTDILTYIIIITVGKIGVAGVLSVLYNDEAKRTGANMRNIVFSKALMLPVNFYEKHHTGDFMAKLTYDTNMASGVFGSRIRRVMMPVIMVCVCIIPMFVLCPPVMAGLLILCILSLTLNFVMIPVMEKYSGNISDGNKEISKSVTNMLQGMETIRMFPLKKVISESYNCANESCGKNMKIQGRIESLIAALRAAFDLIGALVFLALGILYVRNTGGKLGNLVSLYSIYGAFQYNFLLMGQYIPSLASWLVNARRVLDFLDTEEETDREGDGRISSGIDVEHKVEFKNITFGYEGKDANVFENYNAVFDKGKSYALVGESGRRKSTLTKLLLGFYPLKKGQIFIDGTDIKELGLVNARDEIAYIPQEPYLFKCSIMENIRMGRTDATDEEVYAAARQANAHDFIVGLENGYDTISGERGNTLSGGQKQRIAIARAILKNAPIIIFDEATSALDNETERLIGESVMSMKEGRLILMIAHRPSTIETADCKFEV
ncbi:MAG: ABC transporter ATP-binding protein [Lachnospira sp.]